MDETTQKPAKPATTKDHESQSSGGRKTGSARPQEQGLKCPRCDSPNTKFCYYNNYSLTQPRHFCKTCRRYWTKGGALRNIPIGGGCRKNKKVKSSRLCGGESKVDGGGSSSDLPGLKFLHGLSSSMDHFHHLNGLPFPRLHHAPTAPLYNEHLPFGDASSASLAAVNYPFPCFTGNGYNGSVQGMSGAMNVHTSLESLSSMNQDLHWKLQQQRLATLFGGGDNHNNQKDDNNGVSPVVTNLENQNQKPLPILFQNLEVSKPGIFKEGQNTPTEWFLGNSYGSVAPSPTTASGGRETDNNGSIWSSGGVHGWSDVQQQYSALP